MALDVLLPRAMLARPLAGVLVTLLMSATSVSLQPRMRQWTDRLLYNNWYDYRNVVAGLGKTLREAPDPDTLIEQLVRRPVELMGLRGAALFLADESDLLNLKSYAGYESLPETAMHIAAEAPLAKLLSQETGPVTTSDVWQRLANESLSHAEQTWLNAEFAQIWLPLVFQQEFHGVLVLGANKKRGDFFTQDLAILETLAHQIAPVAHSFRLMETLRRQAGEIALLQDERRATSHHRLTDREEERKRLARDLHDQLLQELFALNIALQTTARLVNNASAAEQLAAMRQQVIRLVDQVRDLCSELRPPELDATDLVNAIHSYTRGLVNRWENVQVVGDLYDIYGETFQPSLTITLDLDYKSVDLDSTVAIALFRVYQESLNNIWKHAAAKNVWVSQRFRQGKIELHIRDDGRGFVAPDRLSQLIRQDHFGLVGMQEQMTAIGGKVQITSQPGAGTEVFAWALLQGEGTEQ